MNTTSEPNPGHTGFGSQAAQAKFIANQEEAENLNRGEAFQNMFEWMEEHDPDRLEKLLDNRATKREKEKKNANNNPTPSQTNIILRALQKDWNNTYFPHSLVALRDLIRQYQLLGVDEYYAKTLVFVQSSGMGKSRLADAFGEVCPMINFILRDPRSSGFPPPDKEIVSFMRDEPPADIPGPTSEQGISGGTSRDFLKKRAVVAWNHTLAAALLQASFETCKLAM